MYSILAIVLLATVVCAQHNDYSTGQFAEAQQQQQQQQPLQQTAHHQLADPELVNSYADSYRDIVGELNLGRHLFEGDILLTEQQNDYIQKSQINDGLHTRAIVKDVQKLWPDGEVPYTIKEDLRDESKDFVKSAIKEWKTKTCLKLRPKQDSDKDYIEFIYEGGCSSFVGKIGGKQTISVGAADGSITCKHGNIVHELAHSLGFFHEHSRPDRDKFIKVDYDNVMEGYERNFRKESFETINSRGVDYDYDSVMHYGAFFFTSTEGEKTIVTTKDGAAIGQRVGLSDLDIKQARLLYKCNGKSDDSIQTVNAQYHGVGKSKVEIKHTKKITKTFHKSAHVKKSTSKKVIHKSTHLKKAVKLFVSKTSKHINAKKKSKAGKAIAKTQIPNVVNETGYNFPPIGNMATVPVNSQPALVPVVDMETTGPSYSQGPPAVAENATSSAPEPAFQALVPVTNQETATTSTNQQQAPATNQNSGNAGNGILTEDDIAEENLGKSYFEGDMILSEDQRQYLESLKDDPSQATKRALIKNTTYLWPQRTVYYTFDDSVDDIGKENAEAAVKHWQEKTCLRFQHRKSENDYINFVFEGGCASRVGRGGGMQKLTIGSTELRCKKGNIIHEMGHALGFFHEHSRPDRDDYVDIHLKNILPGYERNFLKFSTKFIDSLNVPYDYGSIMHYGTNFFSKLAMLLPTMDVLKKSDDIAGKDIVIGQRISLSDMDILQANLLYNCDGQKRLSDDERNQIEEDIDYADNMIRDQGPCGDMYDTRSCSTIKSKGYCQKYPRTLRRACGQTCQLCSTVPPDMHAAKKNLLSKLKLTKKHLKQQN